MGTPGKPIEIIEITTGKRYRSIAAVCAEVGWSFTAVRKRIETGSLIDGRLFSYAPTTEPETLAAQNLRLRKENLRLRSLLTRRGIDTTVK